MGSPRKAYSSGVFVTIRRLESTEPSTSTIRSMIRLPPSPTRALGSPPIRVLLPPAWITPVTATAPSLRQFERAPADGPRRGHRHVHDGGGKGGPWRRTRVPQPADPGRLRPGRRRFRSERRRGRRPRAPPRPFSTPLLQDRARRCEGAGCPSLPPFELSGHPAGAPLDLGGHGLSERSQALSDVYVAD